MGEVRKTKTESASPHTPWLLSSAWRFLFTIAIILVVPTTLLVLALSIEFHITLEIGAIKENETALKLGSRLVHHHFEAMINHITDESVNPELADSVSKNDQSGILNQLQRLSHKSRLDRIIITDLKGNEILRLGTTQSVNKDQSQTDWYKGVRSENKTYISAIYQPYDNPKGFFTSIAAPIKNSQGKTMGYIAAEINLEPLTMYLLTVRPTLSGYIYLTDHKGTLAHSVDMFYGKLVVLRRSSIVVDALKGNSSSIRAHEPVNGEECFISYGNVPSVGWALMAFQPVSAVFSPAKGLVTSVILLVALTFLVILAMLFVTFSTIRNYQSKLQDLQDFKEHFFTMMVHDLRNPLTATIGWTKLIQATPDSQIYKIKEFVKGIETSANQLELLLETTLDIIRIEDKKMALKPTRTNISRLVQERAAKYLGMAKESKITLINSSAPEPLETSVDPRLVGRAIDNLITNAIKYTPEGKSIYVAVSHVNSGTAIAITVRDEGPGIPHEYQNQLFQKYRSNGEKTKSFSYGTGLGLYYSKLIVEMHGGKIYCTSEPGKGSTFTIELPTNEKAAPINQAHVVKPL